MYLFTVVPFLPKSLTLDVLSHHVKSISSPADAFRFVKETEGLLWNYSILAPIAMSAIFYASTQLTEEISAGKYPLYALYQKRVGQFWPPVTVLKTAWLFVTRQKAAVDDAVFGAGSGELATRTLGAQGKKRD